MALKALTILFRFLFWLISKYRLKVFSMVITVLSFENETLLPLDKVSDHNEL
jgi:hypothetical protein